MTIKEIGIKTPADLKGKRVAYLPGGVLYDIEREAALAFGGLTEEDIELVTFPSYTASLKWLIEGKVDVGFSGPMVASMYELEASPYGIYWILFPSSDQEGWDRVHKQVVPWLVPRYEDRGGRSQEGTGGRASGLWLPRISDVRQPRL